MSEKDKYPSELAERFQIRLPAGLRDRIKAYAERYGRSMNTEIVRVLEREFPEQWTVDDRMEELGKMLDILSRGRGDPRLDDFVTKFQETVDGIVSGRVIGVDAETRESVRELWSAYKSRESEAAHEAFVDSQMDYDEEEIASFDLIQRHEKYAVPPPKSPEPLKDTFHLMDILPRGPLSEMAERLSKGDTEGAAAIVRSIPKAEIEKRIAFHRLSVFEQDDMRRDPDVDTPEENYNPFKFSE